MKYQKKDEAWKKVPPKDSKKKTQEVGKFTFNWCKHHMAWTVHKPLDCTLGQKHKDDQRKAKKTRPTLLSLSLQPPPSTLAMRPYWPPLRP
jgi:hypothetical protein